MSALEPAPQDDVLGMQPLVRAFIATKLRAVVDQLEPQVDGSYGPVNPRLLELYLKALTETGRLYRVYDPVKKQPDDGPGDDVLAAALRDKVMAELEKIRGQIAGSDGR